MTSQEAAFKRLLDVLHQLGIPYLVTGSLASSVHGVARATMDIDLVANIKPDQIASLAAELGSEFYADRVLMEEALKSGRGFNLIHLASSYKFDIFPLASDRYQQVQFARRKTVQAPLAGPLPLEFSVATAEDTVLSKLLWYKAGGGASERQWQDALGVVRVQGEGLDVNYLREWATNLGIQDLLDGLLSDPAV